MSKRNKWRIAATIPDATRQMLLRMFPPTMENVYCVSLTYQYDPSDGLVWPEGPQNCIITGRHTGQGHEALVCEFAGERFQPGGKRLHITLSTDAGVPPAEAGNIDSDRITSVERVQFPLTLHRLPAWQSQPQRLAEVVLG